MSNLGLYIHIPFCFSKCDYCSFNSITDISLVDEYVEALCKEIACQGAVHKFVVDTIYMGGGTPSILSINQLQRIVECIYKNFSVSKKEFSIECNPDSVRMDKLLAYKNLGINRISVGVQSLSDKCLKLIGRRHDCTVAREKVAQVRKVFDNVSCDFMLNLQYQEKSDILDICQFIKQNDIPHVSLYGLKLEENTPLYNKMTQIDEDYAADLYELGMQKLQEIGLSWYEVSNFSKSSFECLHNLKYWDLSDYLGLGVSAHSYIMGTRYENTDNIIEYIHGKNNRKVILGNTSEQKFEYIMLALRTKYGIDKHRYLSMFGRKFDEEYANILRDYSQFFTITDNSICVNSKGIYLLNSLLIKFL